MLPALLLIACKPPTEVPTDDPGTPPPSDTAVEDTAPTPPPTDTAPEIPVFDCTNLSSGPFQNRRIEGARAYHGIAFDTLGNMVGSDGNLVRVAASNDTSLWVPNASRGEQMDYLPDGDLAFAHSNGNIMRVAPDGGMTVITSNVNAYGLIVGPDGFIYTANQSRVHKIDPVTGDREIYVQGINSPKVINWSPDYSRFYIGTNFSGDVWEVDTDPVTLEILGEPRLLATTSNTWHDSLGVDVCGNLYIAEFWDRRLWRISPEGQTQVLVDYPSQAYGHGITWGSGIGEWDAMAVYVPQPYDNDRVSEAIIGIPERRFNNGVYEIITD